METEPVQMGLARPVAATHALKRLPAGIKRCYPDDTMSPAAEGHNLPEVIFLVEEAAEGGFTARALGESIFTEADDLQDLHEKVRDAVRCHFDEGRIPKIIRLHFVREEVIGT
jgi:hypothetical protein